MDDNALAPMEADRLKELEVIIEDGLQTFAQVGTALLEIRDQKLYRATHKSFEAYLKERWSISRSYAHRTIEAAQVVALLPIDNRPRNEAVARELVAVPPGEREAVWKKVTLLHPEPTARQVREMAVDVVDLNPPELEERSVPPTLDKQNWEVPRFPGDKERVLRELSEGLEWTTTNLTKGPDDVPMMLLGGEHNFGPQVRYRHLIGLLTRHDREKLLRKIERKRPVVKGELRKLDALQRLLRE